MYKACIEGGHCGEFDTIIDAVNDGVNHGETKSFVFAGNDNGDGTYEIVASFEADDDGRGTCPYVF